MWRTYKIYFMYKSDLLDCIYLAWGRDQWVALLKGNVSFIKFWEFIEYFLYLLKTY